MNCSILVSLKLILTEKKRKGQSYIIMIVKNFVF